MPSPQIESYYCSGSGLTTTIVTYEDGTEIIVEE